MSQNRDYCQYYLDKCSNKTIQFALRKIYKTTDDIRYAYENSPCFLKNRDERNVYLLDTVRGYIQNRGKKYDALDIDADKVLQRAINKINQAGKYDDIFEGLADYLWIEASTKLCRDRDKGAFISLIEDAMIENIMAAKWLKDLKEEIDNAKYELTCMEEADNLPLKKKMFLILVDNRDVAWYANSNNISYSERKQRISDFRIFIKEHEMVYFALLVTNIYREELLRRYR